MYIEFTFFFKSFLRNINDSNHLLFFLVNHRSNEMIKKLFLWGLRLHAFRYINLYHVNKLNAYIHSTFDINNNINFFLSNAFVPHVLFCNNKIRFTKKTNTNNTTLYIFSNSKKKYFTTVKKWFCSLKYYFSIFKLCIGYTPSIYLISFRCIFSEIPFRSYFTLIDELSNMHKDELSFFLSSEYSINTIIKDNIIMFCIDSDIIDWIYIIESSILYYPFRGTIYKISVTFYLRHNSLGSLLELNTLGNYSIFLHCYLSFFLSIPLDLQNEISSSYEKHFHLSNFLKYKIILSINRIKKKGLVLNQKRTYVKNISKVIKQITYFNKAISFDRNAPIFKPNEEHVKKQFNYKYKKTDYKASTIKNAFKLHLFAGFKFDYIDGSNEIGIGSTVSNLMTPYSVKGDLSSLKLCAGHNLFYTMSEEGHLVEYYPSCYLHGTFFNSTFLSEFNLKYHIHDDICVNATSMENQCIAIEKIDSITEKGNKILSIPSEKVVFKEGLRTNDILDLFNTDSLLY